MRLARSGQQWFRIDRESAGTELDPDLEVDAMPGGAADPIAGGDRRTDGQRELAELGDHREVAAVIDDQALIEPADRPGVAHRAAGGRDDRAMVLDLDVDAAARQHGLRALV